MPAGYGDDGHKEDNKIHVKVEVNHEQDKVIITIKQGPTKNIRLECRKYDASQLASIIKDAVKPESIIEKSI